MGVVDSAQISSKAMQPSFGPRVRLREIHRVRVVVTTG